ncbi:MAG: HDOD domain-containing protein [Azospira sp.]|jgi:HD-like signal output (HDOD) protein|nr:HDOD domain-containing protein [Azospira sp.]
MSAQATAHSELDTLIKRFDVPPCPAVVSELQSELRRENADAASISRLLSRDVGLSGAVMRLVNSPAFGVGRKVGSINDALHILGFGRIFDLVASESLKKSLDAGPRLDRYWDSAALTAELCAELATRLPGTKRETAYCFGLFHDCGIPLLMRRFPDYRETLIAANAESGLGLLAIEEAAHGTSHPIVGYLLARTWGLSETLCEAIRAHHNYEVLDPQSPDRLPDEICALIAFCAIAEHVASLHLRTREEGQWPAARGRVQAFLGMSEADADDLVDDLLEDLRARDPR